MRITVEVPDCPAASRTVYTLGPASGDYKIEWPDNDNAIPDADVPPIVTLAGDWVVFDGIIGFTGPSTGTLNFTLPAELRPAVKQYRLVDMFDNSADGNGQVTGRLIVGTNGAAQLVFQDSGTFDIDDAVYLSGSYLVAPPA